MLRQLLLVIALAVAVPVHASTKWTPPTQEELTMTSEPTTPGASAVYLFLEETADDAQHVRTMYARIKILTEAGKDRFSDILMPYEDKEESIKRIEARTIHSDGTVVPFTGKPWKKEMVKAAGLRLMEKGFSMPDVQVGSILEYRYETTYDDWWAPRWYVQQPVPLRHAHYHFLPGLGSRVAAVRFLPEDAQLNDGGSRGWDLVLNNVPSLNDEDDSPPSHALQFRVLFYYLFLGADTPEKYWQQQGQSWSLGVDQFAAEAKFRKVVNQIVAPGDTDEQKLRKIYAAVMKMENTDFTREHSAAENKADKLKIRQAADIWEQQRGKSWIGASWTTKLSSRWSTVKRCFLIRANVSARFGKLHWKHSWSMGVRQTEKSTEIATTPFPHYADTEEKRVADLAMDADGAIHGSIGITMTGSIALRWRQEALQSDEDAIKQKFDDEIRDEMPSGVTVTIKQIAGLADYNRPLAVFLNVGGNMASASGKRMFLPGTFFEARAKARFVNAKRDSPVYLHYSYTVQDQFRLALPANQTVEGSAKGWAHSVCPECGFRCQLPHHRQHLPVRQAGKGGGNPLSDTGLSGPARFFPENEHPGSDAGGA